MRRYGRRASILLTVLAALATAPAARAETFTVNGTGDTASDAPCSLDACPSIRAALGAAAASVGPDTIVVPAGDYQLENGELLVDSPVTIRGAGAAATTVRGSAAFRVVEVKAGVTATISSMTLRDATAQGSGFNPGGIVANSGTLALDHMTVTGGHASSGGGVANLAGTLTISQSAIVGNAADIGGADSGGLLNFEGGTMTVSDSTIAGNTANLGGAFSSWEDNGSHNTTTLTRVTVTGNVATGRGTGGLAHAPADSLTVTGSIIAGNTFGQQSANCDGNPVTSGGGNVESGTECGLTGADDLQNTDPQLSPDPDQAGLYTIPATSPAVDRYACSGVDQRDLARPQGARCDAGAYEVDVAPDTTIAQGPDALTFTSDKPDAAFECSLDGAPFAACTSPYSTAGLAPGTHTLAVRAVDSLGSADPTPASATFEVPAPTPTPTPTPTATPTPVPTASPPPAPTPQYQRQVVVQPVQGTVLVRLPGSSRYVPLTAADGVPLGSIVDTRDGRIELTSQPSRGGAPQQATFYGGLFKVTQPGSTTDLQLVEPLASCPKRGHAAAAAKKPRTRKLWGDGSGNFRTRGHYSAATVRGTKWLVQDSCAGTLTRVVRGVVSVRDQVRHRTVLLRAGQRYLAKPR